MAHSETILKEARLLSAFLVIFFASGCSSDFAPVADYHPRLTIYSILYPDTGDTYVRVVSTQQRIQDVITGVSGATVRLISEDGRGLALSETTVAGLMGSSVLLYKCRAVLEPLKNYRIEAVKSGFPEVGATTTILGHAEMKLTRSSEEVLQDPDRSFSEIYYQVSFPMKAAITRMNFSIVYAGLRADGDSVMSEMPVSTYDLWSWSPEMTIQFSRQTYSIYFHRALNEGKKLRSPHYYAKLLVTQLDSAMYKYYHVSTGDEVPYTFRQNTLYYSNVDSGMGIVGSACVDSLESFIQ